MIAATFMTIDIGDKVYVPLRESVVICKVVEKNENDASVRLSSQQGEIRLTEDQFNESGYVYY